jgi:ankyrin repeat protein
MKNFEPQSELELPLPRQTDDGLNVDAINVAPGGTALHWAAARGDKDMVKVLLHIGPRTLNQRDGLRRTPLWYAVEYHKPDVAMLLLDHNTEQKSTADTDNSGGVGTFLAAVENNYEKVVEHLLKCGSKINDTDERGETALQVAARCGHGNLVQLLLKSHADVNAADPNGRTALHEAAILNSERGKKIREDLLSHGASQNVDARDVDGRTPLHEAAVAGAQDAVLDLLQRGADINAKDNTRRGVLHIAIDEAHNESIDLLEMVELLLAKDVDPNATDATHFTAMHKATEKGYERVVEQLLKSGTIIDVDALDNDSRTALHIAASRGLRMAVSSLILAGASVEKQDSKRQTPLHEALKRAAYLNRRSIDWIGFLMGENDLGRRVLTQQDIDGNTPLHVAIMHNAKLDLVQKLVSACPATTYMPNKKAMSPYDCFMASMLKSSSLVSFPDADAIGRILVYNSVRHAPSHGPNIWESRYHQNRGKITINNAHQK